MGNVFINFGDKSFNSGQTVAGYLDKYGYKSRQQFQVNTRIGIIDYNKRTDKSDRSIIIIDRPTFSLLLK